jgi:hypothetical protein
MGPAAGDWATWRSTGQQQGKSRGGFGRAGEQDAGKVAAQQQQQQQQRRQEDPEDDWQKVLGVPGKGSRSSKRARVSASARLRQPRR